MIGAQHLITQTLQWTVKFFTFLIKLCDIVCVLLHCLLSGHAQAMFTHKTL